MPETPPPYAPNPPKRYVPGSRFTIAQPPRKLAFACGVVSGVSQYGMYAGPFDTLQEALDTAGRDAAVIIRFNPDGTHRVLYTWDGTAWCTTQR